MQKNKYWRRVTDSQHEQINDNPYSGTLNFSASGVAMFICQKKLARAVATLAACLAALTVGGAHAGDSTTVIPGDGPVCTLVMPSTISFNTVLTNSLTVPLVGNCTRFPVKWEWTAPPLDYTGRNMAGDNALFQPLFDSGIMSWIYDNRKVTNTNAINLTFTTTGTHTFAVRAKDADYIPPANQPAGFWRPWGAPGFTTIDTSGAWQTLTLTCSPVDQTRILGSGGVGVCTGGRVSTLIETRTFCADSTTPIFGPWIPSTTCTCPSGKVWDGVSCVPVPICTVRPSNASPTPGQSVPWVATCDLPVTTITWVPTTPPAPPVAACPSAGGALCTQTYPTPQTVCYSVSGTGIAGVGPTSAPACATVACAPPTLWSAGAAACGTPPTITPPTFQVGFPQPASIPVTVTGTTPLCSASNLPSGWTMTTGCSLTPAVPGATQPPVPLSCTVTATNAWGFDTQRCLDINFSMPTCSARFNQTPIQMSRYTLTPTDEYGVQDRYSVPSRSYAAGVSGNGNLQINVVNGDSVQSVSCTGISVATPSSTGASGGAQGIFDYTVAYAKNLGVAASDYFVTLPEPETQIVTLPDGTTSVFDVSSRHFIIPAQSATPDINASVCTVVVKNSSSGLTGTCRSDPVAAVDTSAQKSCQINLSMQRWVYQRASLSDRTLYENRAAVPGGAQVNFFTRVFDSFNPPNTSYLTGRVHSSAQLGPVPLSASTQNINVTDSLVCKKVLRTSANSTATLASAAPFLISPSLQQNIGPIPALGYGGGSEMEIEQVGAALYTSPYDIVRDVPSSPLIESFDPGNADYDIECSLSATGFDGSTGAPTSVSCGAYYSYRAGAICRFEGSSGAGLTVTSVRYADGSSGTITSNPNSGYDGAFKYLAESGQGKFASELALDSPNWAPLVQKYNGVTMYTEGGTTPVAFFAPIMLNNKNTLFDLGLTPSTSSFANSAPVVGSCGGYCTVGAKAIVKRRLFNQRLSTGSCSVLAEGIPSPSGSTTGSTGTIIGSTVTVRSTTGTTTTTDGRGGSTTGSGTACTGAGC